MSRQASTSLTAAGRTLSLLDQGQRLLRCVALHELLMIRSGCFMITLSLRMPCATVCLCTSWMAVNAPHELRLQCCVLARTNGAPSNAERCT